MNFVYSAPTKVYFGTIDNVNLCSEIGRLGKKILVLSGGISTTSIAEQIVAILKNDFSVELYSGILTNPSAECIESIVKKASIPDVIISVGGGSVHDSSKILSILYTHIGTIEQFTTDGNLGPSSLTNKTLPLITIPTIFGSGAEVSPAALVRINNKKKVVFNPYGYPRTTFINPIYGSTLSRKCCINTALDALVQGVESFVSTKGQDFSRRFSCSAIERVIRSLLELDNPENSPKVLEQLALASIESLYAVGQATVGAVHAISDPLSGIFNLHHGEAVGLLFPQVVEVNYHSAKEQYDYIQKLFDKNLGIKSTSLSNAIIEFYNQIGFDYKSIAKELNTCGIKDKLQYCIQDSYNGDMDGNPCDLNDLLIAEILEKSLR